MEAHLNPSQHADSKEEEDSCGEPWYVRKGETENRDGVAGISRLHSSQATDFRLADVLRQEL